MFKSAVGGLRPTKLLRLEKSENANNVPIYGANPSLSLPMVCSTNPYTAPTYPSAIS